MLIIIDTNGHGNACTAGIGLGLRSSSVFLHRDWHLELDLASSQALMPMYACMHACTHARTHARACTHTHTLECNVQLSCDYVSNELQ